MVYLLDKHKKLYKMHGTYTKIIKNPFRPGQNLEFKPEIIWTVKI